jgi:HlyD family secretion protein
MKTRTWLTLAASGTALALALAWAFAPRPVEVEVARAEPGPFERTIDEDAKTRVTDRYVVAAPLSGRLARIILRDGDRVEAGMAVARLAPTLAPLVDTRTLAEQRGRVETAQAGVARAAAGAERARVGVEQARAEWKRSEQLSRQGFVSVTKLDTDKLALQAAHKELDAAVQAGRMAQYELQTARAALQAVQQGPARGGDFEVKAPVAGTLLRVLQTSEAPVALGTPLLELGDTTRLEVVAELLTTDALQLAPGTPVHIERWGGPGDLQGRLRMIEPAAVTKVSALGVEEQRVKALIDLTSPPAQWKALGDGYRVTVRVVAESHAKVLRVPVSAVFPRTDGQPGMAVFRVQDGRARLVQVDLGGRNGALAWLRGGLAEGDTVIVYPPSTVTDGVRVKPRPLKTAASAGR